MSKRRSLSKEQIEELQKSPHILFVSEKAISYSAKFKEHVYREYQAGKSYETIVIEAGIDPDVLGPRRLNSLRTMVQAEGKREMGFTDKNSRLPPRTLSARVAKTNTGKIARLEHELAYTRQELEYLKKIYLADMEAQKACDTKRHRKSNSGSSEA
jgi:transposase